MLGVARAPVTITTYITLIVYWNVILYPVRRKAPRSFLQVRTAKAICFSAGQEQYTR